MIKKLARHAGFLAAGGVLFGLVAALTFAYVEPKIEKNMQRKEVPYVNIPGDEEPGTQEEQSSEDNGQGEQQTGDNAGEDSQAAQADSREITLDDYKNLYTEILKQAEEPKKAMVTVIGSKKDEDWFQTPYENQISGLIVADNGQEMFILTEYR
ncbi:MAG: serine protease, partial [Blautia marasmi]